MSAPDRADVWKALQALVTDRLDDYRREVAAVSGLPFSRVRALRRLAQGPMTHAALAESMMVDRPAATVAVDDLCARGLVRREPHPTDRRAKLVSLTDEGRRVAALVETVVTPAPPGWDDIDAADLATLLRVVRSVTDADGQRASSLVQAGGRRGGRDGLTVDPGGRSRWTTGRG